MTNFLKGIDGKISSKRVIGFCSFIVAVVLAFMGKDPVTIGIFMGTTTAVFIAQAVSKT